MTIHTFNDSEAAYYAYQHSDAVKFGDTLVVESEGVVGVACTYAFSVSEATGDLTEFTWDEPITHPSFLLTLVDSIRAAVAEAARRGITIAPAFQAFRSEET